MSNLALYDPSDERGRPQAVSKDAVFEALSDGDWHTKKELANDFDVCASTVASRVRELVADGWGVIVGPGGYQLVEASDITDEEAAVAVERFARYMIGTVTRQAMSAKPVKKLLAAARKLLPKTRDERVIVRKYLVQLTHLIDWDEADDIV